MKAMIIGTFVFCAMIAGLLKCADNYLSLPVVYENTATGECVVVMSQDPNHSCDNLPKKYDHKYADPWFSQIKEHEE